MGGIAEKTKKRLAWEAKDKLERDKRMSQKFVADLQTGYFAKEDLLQLKKIAHIYDLKEFEILVNGELKKYG